ncbi:exosome complex component RRP4 homolog isoform X2 [Selaginella moellendorffii]|uniref:exosome complex component RRP4 homolog isoform X2 n=1 Tax=Selaginella moellendorffii TaxID=88036 RepID=UPI000D1CB940|nr:exosome complex component RRP4 homolog isoform X2 [Selaginella moellendorffii]|eukprot:XP_024522066.1 exosome complex component RRP4 homolog isoform X2 [Selaginella moellendorffii]
MDQVVVIGDSLAIPGKESVSSGHGSQSVSGEIRATVCGILRPQGSFITVDPFLTRYKPEKGHVVIGRIVEVAQGSWRVDISCDRHARLELSSVDLPASIQRRRTAADELNMRNFLVETDVIRIVFVFLPRSRSRFYLPRPRSPRPIKAGQRSSTDWERFRSSPMETFLKKGQAVKVKPYLLKMKKHVHVFHAKECQVRSSSAAMAGSGLAMRTKAMRSSRSFRLAPGR